MKKFIALLMVTVLMLVPLLAGCEPSMQEKYADVFAKLAGNTWFYEGDTANSVNKITFTAENVIMGMLYNDGNGCHSGTESTYTYVIDDTNITVTLVDGSSHVIPYSFNGTDLVLEGYFTPTEIAEGLNGFWKSRETDYIFGELSESEDNVHIDGNKIVHESASKARGYNDGRYYYHGPDEGNFSVTEEGIKTDISNSFQYGFVIESGIVKLMLYDDVCERSTFLPGGDGYIF